MKISKIIVNKIVILSFLFGISNCISISKIETSHLNVSPVDNKYYPEDILIFVIGGQVNSDVCITDKQRALVKSWYNRYFSYNHDDRINIYIKFQSNISEFQLAANAAVSLITYTIIPAYGSVVFDIDVETFNGKSIKYQSAKVFDEGLISVLALPFYFSKSLLKVRRNNIENGFYHASLQPFTDAGDFAKYVGLKPTADCRGLVEDWPKINRASSMPW